MYRVTVKFYQRTDLSSCITDTFERKSSKMLVVCDPMFHIFGSYIDISKSKVIMIYICVPFVLLFFGGGAPFDGLRRQ